MMRLERDGVVTIYTIPAPADADPGRRQRVTFGELVDYCLARHEAAENACRAYPDSKISQHDRACFFQLASIVAACGESDAIKVELRSIARRKAAEVAAEGVPSGGEGDQEPGAA